uniref:SHR-BD domain-containing protein n=1 Tax=Steinernema glaseri TaxID=37863 RepID=A0A1I7ZSA8_9BILA
MPGSRSEQLDLRRQMRVLASSGQLSAGMHRRLRHLPAPDPRFLRARTLLNHVSVSVAVDETQGIKLVWSLEEAYSIIIREITAADIRWIVQSRGDNSSGWQWTPTDSKAFRESLQLTSFVPLLQSSSAQVRLAVEWRSNIIVSRTFVSQLNSKAPRPITLSSQLQIAANRYVVCWNADSREEFKVVLTSLDSKVISTVQTKASCHLFKELPTENCCRATISDANAEGSEVVVKIELAPVVSSTGVSLESKLIFTNGTALLRMANTNDFLMLADPEVLKFQPPTEKNITGGSLFSIRSI